MKFSDRITPELLRIKGELEQLQKLRIKVGIQGDADSEILTIARVHEYGAVIHAKQAKNLCIPINKESYDKSPRDFPDLFFIRSDKGYLLGVVEDKTKKRRRKTKQHSDYGVDDGSLKILFLLLPSVTIPERSFIRAGYDANRNLLADVCQQAMGKIIHEKWDAHKAAEWIGGKAVDLIHEFMSDASNFEPKGRIQKERAPSLANNPLTVTKRLFNSVTWKVEEGD